MRFRRPCRQPFGHSRRKCAATAPPWRSRAPHGSRPSRPRPAPVPFLCAVAGDLAASVRLFAAPPISRTGKPRRRSAAPLHGRLTRLEADLHRRALWQGFGQSPPVRLCQSRRQVRHGFATVRRPDLPTGATVRNGSRFGTATGSPKTRRNRPPLRSYEPQGFAPAPPSPPRLCRSCAPWRAICRKGSPSISRPSACADLPTGSPMSRQAQPCAVQSADRRRATAPTICRAFAWAFNAP